MGPIGGFRIPRHHSANGIRTRVWALRGPRPSPLDDSAVTTTIPELHSELRINFEVPVLAVRNRPTGPEGIEPPTAGFGDRCSTN